MILGRVTILLDGRVVVVVVIVVVVVVAGDSYDGGAGTRGCGAASGCCGLGESGAGGFAIFSRKFEVMGLVCCRLQYSSR